MRTRIFGEEDRDPLADDAAELDNAASKEFSQLLDNSFKTSFSRLRVGEQMPAKVVSIGTTSIFLDLGQRSEGSIDLGEFTPEELQGIKPGSILNLYVAKAGGSSGIELTKRFSRRGLDLSKLTTAMEGGIPVEGKVTGENKGGYEVEIAGGKGFVPFSQIDAAPRQASSEYIGKTFRFLVSRIQGKDVILSRAALQRQEQQVEQEKMLANLSPGDALTAKIIKIESFGAFCDLGSGVTALIPRSEIGWSRGIEPSSAVSIGQTVGVKILNVGRENGRLRISASMKQSEQDPWETSVESLAVGQTVSGTVTALMKFGAFVEVKPGIEGLLHISEMSAKKRVTQPGEVVAVGQKIDVKVVALDRINKRLSLSLKGDTETLDAETKAKYLKQQQEADEHRGVEHFDAPGTGGSSAFAAAFAEAGQKRKK